ncbi:MAG: hypothetical protein ACI906_002945 [Candidatus Latescibacterota bacterium]|jgi:hypothetical protein
MHQIVVLIGFVLAIAASSWAQNSAAPSALNPLSLDGLVAALAALPDRRGPAPRTPFAVPHVQFDQNAPVVMQDILLAAVQTLPDIVLWRETPFSIPPAVGWVLPEDLRGGPENAYSPEGEFGHSHRPEDGSMHLRLPATVSRIVFERGWGILHPFSAVVTGQKEVTYIMVYGPRDDDELAAVWAIVQASYAFARGLNLDGVTAVTPATWGALKRVDSSSQ